MIITILVIVGFVVSFAAGILVGRKNAAKVSAVVATAQTVETDVKKL